MSKFKSTWTGQILGLVDIDLLEFDKITVESTSVFGTFGLTIFLNLLCFQNDVFSTKTAKRFNFFV